MIVLQRFECNRMSVTVRPPAQQKGSLPPRKCTPAVNCGVFTLLIAEQGCDSRDVSQGIRWKWLAGCQVLLIPRRTRMIGRKETCRSEAIEHLLEVRGARQDVVVRIKGVET
jgi:hypothetical protein